MKQLDQSRKTRRHAAAARSWQRVDSGRRSRGAISIMFLGMFIVIIGFFGLALDMGRVYNRKAEMQSVADSVAISAAKKLNGTSAGITDAVAAATAILDGGPYKIDWMRPKYEYTQTMTLAEAAITFGESADGGAGWVDVTTAKAAPEKLLYVRVDTSALGAAYGKVDLFLMPALSSSLASVTVGHTAIAGRRLINVTPLAICAMSTVPAAQRLNPGNGELVEYGFRRGVSYDLMQLNNKDTAPANFLVDPVALPGPGSSPTNFETATVGPYVCAGTMALAKVSGATVHVKNDFPIDTLFDHLNSRFDASNGKCDPVAAPPDTNIKPYTPASITWMTKPTGYQTAEISIDSVAKKRQTIADLDPPNNQGSIRYGPLWVFARAVPWSSYTAGKPEPGNGYLPFSATQAIWNSLYRAGTGPTYGAGPTIGSYPSPAGLTTPYTTLFTAPTLHPPGIKNRRVLNVPLLECPVSGGSAKVLAIGKFFMTVTATTSTVSAEFAGATTDDPVGGTVELFQ
jgi:hypothetical protein